MSHKYNIEYDYYSATSGKFIIKVELGDDKLFGDNERIKDIINECGAVIEKKEWRPAGNNYISYDTRPESGDFIIRYTLSFDDEAHKKYFLFTLHGFYAELNYLEEKLKIKL